MKTIELNAIFREKTGKAEAKKVRQKKQTPAIVYGHQAESMPVAIEDADFERVIHTKAGENVVIHLKVSGKKKLDQTVRIKEIQHDPVTDCIDHVDLIIISLTEKIKVNVPFETKGESVGVKEGGVLDIVRHEIEVECLPAQIPEKLEADISVLKIGDGIHIKDISFPKDVACLLAEDEVVVAVHSPKIEEEAPAEGEAPTEPELIGKGKEEGEPAEAGETAKPEEKKEKAKEQK